MRFKKLLAAAVTAAMAAMMVVVPASVETLPTSGTLTEGAYELTGNVELTDKLIVEAGATVTIDLNGYDISVASTAVSNAINNSGTLTIYGGGTITGNKNGIYNEGALTATDVEITTSYIDGVGLWNGDYDWDTDKVTAA